MTDTSWFKTFASSPECMSLEKNPIVYFCAEYALQNRLPTYAGGLGVLAGDLLSESAEHHVPFLALGLYYHQGYISSDVSPDGVISKQIPTKAVSDPSLRPVVDDENNRIIFTVPIQDTLIYVQAWSWHHGSVTLYLLDTDVVQNTEEDKRITDQLYPSNKEVKFKQEMILGLGGLRLLEVLHIHPCGYHLNEGFSALLPFEITRQHMKKSKRTFHDELIHTKQQIVYTNHTLVPAGNDTFSADLVATLLAGFAKELQVPVNDLISLGLIPQSRIFSMTLLSLHMSGKINAVSNIHSEKAKEIWKDYPMVPITNGIHIKTWDAVHTTQEIWNIHQQNKRKLLQYIQSVTHVHWDEQTLLVGWARRIVSYKRPLALLENVQQMKHIATREGKSIKIVLSGLAHEGDAEGLELLQQILRLATGELKDILVYLPDYSFSIAKQMVSGCDIWLNTPVVGFEACGTSGMKAALNGVLPFSTVDGWVAEADMKGSGWLLDNENLNAHILAILEHDIVPLYYDTHKNSISIEWVAMMKKARNMIIDQFSATTMFQKYIEEFYLPLIKNHQSM